MNNKLIKLDFTNGIRADDIQYNFDIMQRQADRERARIGGFGIVEGFEVEVLSDTQVRVKQGILINEKGEELIIPEKLIPIAPPEPQVRELLKSDEAIEVDANGQIKLPHKPYSRTKRGYFNTTFYQDNYPTTELIISDANNPSERIRAIRVEGNLITLDANIWAGKKVLVKYEYAFNRLDAIVIDESGNYPENPVRGTMSTSPSHVDLEQFKGHFIIAIIEVVVGEQNSLKAHDDYKTFRKVYVDRNNRLFLNGKLYKESQFVYFEMPKDPQINDLWYDSKNNKLNIWKDQDGTVGWVTINEERHIPIKEVRIYTPEENPEDLQTFRFGEEELNLRFVPGHNQLEVIIDNAPLMSDQFDEIIDPTATEYVNSGVGFKLKNPLDKATYVEVRVLHSVQITPLRETFQRSAIFVNESFVFHSSSNTAQLYFTDAPYIIGENQLEVFVDGVKLEKDLEFIEVLHADNPVKDPENIGKSSNVYKVLKEIEPGQKVSYRITKNVYTYDHLDALMNDIEAKADTALEEIDKIKEEIDAMDQSVTSKFNTIDNNIVQIAQQLGEQDNYLKKTDELTVKNMPQIVLDGIFGSSFTITEPAESIIAIPKTKLTDFMLVFYVSPSLNRVLLKDIDYVLQAEGEDLFLMLNSELVDSANTIYIAGIRFGIEREE